jgi:hypothetical protein
MLARMLLSLTDSDAALAVARVSGVEVGMLAPHHLQTRSFGLLRSLLRTLNGTKMRASALLTRLKLT